MTYKEHLKQLSDKFDKALVEFEKLDREISKAKGFIDKNIQSKYFEADKLRRTCHQEYLKAIAYIRDNKIDPNDTMKSS
ncbi:hypothetical protein [Edaphocola aurantiacus]|uniref:hypothetical protein n=1 Tax=Edaphocola aurantiacus TaxID=2601682 RepID=UPI001C988FBA|nr:hypothetical protein [Edaphocola aurantiacus]